MYYSSFTKKEMKILEKYCKDNNLYMLSDSDCYGDKKLDRKIEIGNNNLNMSEDVINDRYNA